MLNRNMFLFGSVDVNEGSVTERLDELTEIQNASIRIASKKLFANTQIKHFTHMDMGMELEVDLLKQKSAEYARAKELAIRAARDMVDVENIKHITENQTLIGDVVEKTAEDWKAQKEIFYQQTGIGFQPVKDSLDIVKEKQEKFSQQEVAEEHDGNEDFSKELEAVLLSEQNECDFEE
ncbi:uncharacterized protein LOC107773028 [Nicotiana tabacum]|uniref:Uncharacterized protein n=6 Tax=Nicotiana tabacum TaxID=4097 RepID=A0A1S3Y7J3_TOBAC|nr:uncharacterized protein LOC104109828 [Nicotiana tomentosiformis]XP_009617489.1 uncharacterized protein LOC104109828 [Nicotiana tomentosiformis]XP_009617490.1 uncharacterized protein LOC104109828 [Nicotiana tomentosiformis]XP_009617491.1 uncharacterized protein LOC104109828 [Nicotiana tomentosiformis]XP_016447963.1 PREDICTED: uncharacterized protein LOC107773028 [Nicotiana tabacum]XP_016447964.1 PREDICTED: uncharacterized protein LOC107773028 [Nicotiana tabacum]XP_016447965.1 PREDICTED: unc